MHYAGRAYPMPVALVGTKTRQAAFLRGTEAELTATAGPILQCSMCTVLHWQTNRGKLSILGQGGRFQNEDDLRTLIRRFREYLPLLLEV